MPTTTDSQPEALDRVVAARQHVVELRERQEREMRQATRRLAEAIRDARDDPDPRVNPSSAARAIGVNKNYAHQLIRALERGELDD